MCFLTLSDSLSDLISAHAEKLEAYAEKLKLDNLERKKELNKLILENKNENEIN